MGLRPDGIIGHSLGEVACAYADGCISQEEAILSAYWRGQCIKEANIPPGAMAAVGRCCPLLPHPAPPLGLRVSVGGGHRYWHLSVLALGRGQGLGAACQPLSSPRGENDPDSLLRCAPGGLGAQHTCPRVSVEASVIFT